jgi:hypothetical protein
VVISLLLQISGPIPSLELIYLELIHNFTTLTSLTFSGDIVLRLAGDKEWPRSSSLPEALLSPKLFSPQSFLLPEAFFSWELCIPWSSLLLSDLLFPERFFAELISTRSIILL